MPNHCYNELTVSGPEKDLADFHNRINFDDSENGGIIRTFLPFPTELEGEEIKDKDGKVVGRAFTNEGYTWCLSNWGTKWGDYDTAIEEGPYDAGDGVWEVKYTYTTAWSPALEAIASIAEEFPKLTFSNFYQEEGMGFMGNFSAEGNLVADDCRDIGGEGFPDYPEQGDLTEEQYREALDAYDEAVNEAMNRLRDELLSA